MWLVAMLVACAPMSKENYMEQYADFMTEVSEKASSYTEKEWTKCDEKYKRFSEDLYEKFKSEMTMSEKLMLAGYEVKYQYYRVKSTVDFDGIVDGVNSFIDSFNEDDVNTLLDMMDE